MRRRQSIVCWARYLPFFMVVHPGHLSEARRSSTSLCITFAARVSGSCPSGAGAYTRSAGACPLPSGHTPGSSGIPSLELVFQ